MPKYKLDMILEKKKLFESYFDVRTKPREIILMGSTILARREIMLSSN